MKLRDKLLAASIAAALAPLAANALTGPSGVCPIDNSYATDCNLFINFQGNGSIATTLGPEVNYDGVEDALVGVYNNTNSPISSFSISGSNIFGFDYDGINTYTGVSNAAAGLSTGISGGGVDDYGGADAFFNITDSNTGVVNFLNPIQPGQTDYFSLEESVNVNALPTIGQPGGGTVPEPATLSLFGLGLAALGWGRRRKHPAAG